MSDQSDTPNPSTNKSPNRSSRRDFMKGTTALGVATALPGALVARQGHATEMPKRGGHLRVGAASGNTTDSLDPALMSSEFTNVSRQALYNALVEVDHTGALRPELAESWEPGDSADTWIFDLRKDVTYHDGKSLEANDVIDTIRYHGSEESKSTSKTVAKTITDMRADGKHRVVFTLTEPNAHFPFLASNFEIRPSKDGELYDVATGTGSYILKEFDPGVRLLVERDPNHWRDGVGHFDSAEVIPILDPAARQNALVTGDVDVISRPDRKTWQRLNAAPGVQVEIVKGMLHRTWPMHVDTPPYDNNDVRLALKYTVDREQLVEKVLNNTGSVGNDHPIAPANAYFNTELPQRVYDPDKARFHLEKAGMTDLRVELSTSEAIWDGAVDAAIIYSETAAKAGITLKVNKVPNDGYWSNVWLKHPFCASYWSGRPTEDWMFTSAYSAEASWNESRWKHPRFNELLRAARGELDEAKAREMYWEMQQLCRDEGGSIIPVFADHLIAYSSKLAHGEIAGNWEMDGFHLIERWWFA